VPKSVEASFQSQDELAKTRQALPWRVVKDYEFEGPSGWYILVCSRRFRGPITDSLVSGPVKLSDLFGTKSDLLVYHLMFDTDWTRACSVRKHRSDVELAIGFIGCCGVAVVQHLVRRDQRNLATSEA
jgi:predicted dithiol-disulfide oxidoreductase (DUF899 family)